MCINTVKVYYKPWNAYWNPNSFVFAPLFFRSMFSLFESRYLEFPLFSPLSSFLLCSPCGFKELSELDRFLRFLLLLSILHSLYILSEFSCNINNRLLVWFGFVGCIINLKHRLKLYSTTIPQFMFHRTLDMPWMIMLQYVSSITSLFLPPRGGLSLVPYDLTTIRWW